MNNAKVSIIMATYNRAHLIAETLDSIQNQTYKNWECLIIDDEGTDHTKEVLQPYIEDQRIQYFLRPEKYQKGLPGCRNFGLDIAKGDYIVFFDDDDIVHPENLSTCVEYIQSTALSFCRYHRAVFSGDFHYNFSNTETIESFVINPKDYKRLITNELPFNSCAIVWKRECFETIRFVESLQYAEEWECYTRILTSGFSGVSINKTLFYGRKHPNSNTGEFWSKVPVRRKSKVEACRLVIEHLSKNRLMDYELGVYFISLSNFLKEKKVFRYLKANKNVFSILEWLKLQLRYYLYGMIKPMYKIKKQYLE